MSYDDGECAHAPTRPTVPVVAWAAVGLWAGLSAAEWATWQWPETSHVLCAAAVLTACLGGLLLWARGRRGAVGTLSLCALAVVAGLAYGSAFWARHDTVSVDLGSAARYAWEGEVVSDPVVTDSGAIVDVRLATPRGSRVTVFWPAGTPAPRSGELVSVRGRFQAGERGDPDAHADHQAGMHGIVRAWRGGVLGWSNSPAGRMGPFRERVRSIIGGVGGDAGGFLQGIVLGDRGRIRGTPAEEAFRITGTAHLLAVSGTHLAIVAMLASWSLGALGVSRKKRIVPLALAGLAYVLLSGMQVSSLRAWWMALVAAGAPAAGRRGDSLAALSVAVIALLAIDPCEAFSLGLRLSVAAVGALIVFSPLAECWLRSASPRSVERLASALAVPIVAQLGTSPVSIPAFHTYPVVGPLANIVAVPLASLSLLVGLAGAVLALVSRSLAALAMRAAAVPARLCLSTVTWFSGWPHAAVPVGGEALAWSAVAALLGVGVWALWPIPNHRRARTALAIACLASVVWVFGVPVVGGGARMVVLDVGQGDAILLQDAAGAVLVDTGPDPSTLLAALGRAGVHSLDAVVLTHPHADHTGGLPGLRGVVGVGRVLLARGVDEGSTAWNAGGYDSASGTLGTLGAGDRFRVGGFTFKVLWPDPAELGPCDANDSSLIIGVTHGAFRAVLTGDAESAPQALLAGEGLLERCDVLKVPHHGSKECLDADALAIWSPHTVVISVGEGNDFGHPAVETISQLEAAGIRVERTDRAGDVEISIGGTGWRIAEESRGDPAIACATIGQAFAACGPMILTEEDGPHRPDRPQERLPHIRSRGPAPRPSCGASQEAPVRCRGP